MDTELGSFENTNFQPIQNAPEGARDEITTHLSNLKINSNDEEKNKAINDIAKAVKASKKGMSLNSIKNPGKSRYPQTMVTYTSGSNESERSVAFAKKIVKEYINHISDKTKPKIRSNQKPIDPITKVKYGAEISKILSIKTDNKSVAHKEQLYLIECFLQ